MLFFALSPYYALYGVPTEEMTPFPSKHTVVASGVGQSPELSGANPRLIRLEHASFSCWHT